MRRNASTPISFAEQGKMLAASHRLRRIRFMLCCEWLRRMATVRVRTRATRSPKNPNSPGVESPAVQVLYRLPEEQREKLQDALLDTGDLRILSGHMLVMADPDMKQFGGDLESFQRNARKILNQLFPATP